MKILVMALIAGVGGVLLGVCLEKWEIFSGGSEKEFTEKIDNNHDGKADVEYIIQKGETVSARTDRNFDGNWDYFEWFKDGQIVRFESDDDFDGAIDGWGEFEFGNLTLSKHDLDTNGIPDVANRFRFGIILVSVTRLNGDTSGARVEVFSNGILSKQYLDKNKDGLFEKVSFYDGFGNFEHEMDLDPAIEPSKIEEHMAFIK